MMDLGNAPDNAAGAPCFVLATELRPGDRLRDHGRLRTALTVKICQAPFAKVVIAFEDPGDDLSIPLHEHVTVWRTQ